MTKLLESPFVLDDDPTPNQQNMGWQQNATKQTERIHPRRGLARVGRPPPSFGPVPARACQFGVLAAELGGRWNAETAQFISALARARSSSVLELQARIEVAWIRGRSAILACSAA